MFGLLTRLGFLGLPVLWVSFGSVCAESFTFTLHGTDACSVSVAPPRPKSPECHVWRRIDLGRFGTASLTALQMVTTDSEGVALGEVLVTETDGEVSRVVTRQRPQHDPDIADLSWADGDKPPVPHLENSWTAAAAQVGDAIVVWVGGVPNPALVKLGGRWRETKIREVIASARTAATGRLIGQLIEVTLPSMEAAFASFEPLDPRRAGPAIRGDLAVHRLVVHPSGILELGERLSVKPLPPDGADAAGGEGGGDQPMRFEPNGVAACAVSAYADDSDPAGLNLRSEPSSASRVLTRIPTLGGYGMDFEITGAKDGWFRVKAGSYPLGTDELGPKAARNFSGTAWVHGSKLATSPTYRELHVLPHLLSGVVARIDNMPGGASAPDAPGSGRVRSLLGCFGRWIEMEVTMPSGALHRGWMPRHCANQLTTCG